jgi:hypothetical protein
MDDLFTSFLKIKNRGEGSSGSFASLVWAANRP